MSSKSADFIEFVHTSEFFESLFTIILLFLVVAEFIGFIKELWPYADQAADKEYDQHETWTEQMSLKIATGDVPASNPPDSVQRNVQEGLNPNNNEKTISVELPAINAQLARPLAFYIELNVIFNEHLPIIMCSIVMGILTWQDKILSLACFFCYIFCSFLFNYAKLYEKMTVSIQNQNIPRYLPLASGSFIILYFVILIATRQFIS